MFATIREQGRVRDVPGRRVCHTVRRLFVTCSAVPFVIFYFISFRTDTAGGRLSGQRAAVTVAERGLVIVETPLGQTFQRWVVDTPSCKCPMLFRSSTGRNCVLQRARCRLWIWRRRRPTWAAHRRRAVNTRTSGARTAWSCTSRSWPINARRASRCSPRARRRR
jgi:hypothetical protein